MNYANTIVNQVWLKLDEFVIAFKYNIIYFIYNTMASPGDNGTMTRDKCQKQSLYPVRKLIML